MDDETGFSARGVGVKAYGVSLLAHGVLAACLWSGVLWDSPRRPLPMVLEVALHDSVFEPRNPAGPPLPASGGDSFPRKSSQRTGVSKRGAGSGMERGGGGESEGAYRSDGEESSSEEETLGPGRPGASGNETTLTTGSAKLDEGSIHDHTLADRSASKESSPATAPCCPHRSPTPRVDADERSGIERGGGGEPEEGQEASFAGGAANPGGSTRHRQAEDRSVSEGKEWITMELPPATALCCPHGSPTPGIAAAEKGDERRAAGKTELTHGTGTSREANARGPGGERTNLRGSSTLCCSHPVGEGARLTRISGSMAKEPEKGSGSGTGRGEPEGRGGSGIGRGGGAFAAGGKGVGELDGRLTEYLQALRRRVLEYTSYPISARRFGMEGAVTVALVLGCDGQRIDIELVRSSPFTVLNMAALETVKKVPPLPPLPDGTCGETVRVLIPFTYRLER